MSYDWGPHFIVPSTVSRTFSGTVQLREQLDSDLLKRELEALGLPAVVVDVTNPWYYRRKGTDTWVKIGESNDMHQNFPVSWHTSDLENGEYEVLGLMHVFVRKGEEQGAIARHSIVEVMVKN